MKGLRIWMNGTLVSQAKAVLPGLPGDNGLHGTGTAGSGATFFTVGKGRLVMPSMTSDIFETITRATLMEAICPDLSMDCGSGRSSAPSAGA